MINSTETLNSKLDELGLSSRRATNDDSPQVKSIIATVLEEFEREPDPAGVDRDLENIEGSYANGYFGVLSDANDIVGCYGLFPLATDRAEIRKMYILPVYRGNGLGRLLLNDLIERATKMGFSNLRLETLSHMHAAIHLYRSAGFVEINHKKQSPRCDKTFEQSI